MAQFRTQKIEETLMHLAAEFLQRESNRISLITVTGISLTNKFTKAVILLSVLPDHKAPEALDFVRRKRSEFKEYIKEHSKLQRIPLVDFEIDFGEKNRQRIEEISTT